MNDALDEVLQNYGGVEPIDTGNLDDIKEQRSVIPATKGVMVQIDKAEVRINEANTYRSLNLQLKLTRGIDDTGKFKGKVVFGRVCYYADPNVYTKDFFKSRQHLIALKQLRKAVGIEETVVDGHFLDKLTRQLVKVDITVRKRKMMVDDGAGSQQEIEVMENETRNYRSVDPLDLV